MFDVDVGGSPFRRGFGFGMAEDMVLVIMKRVCSESEYVCCEEEEEDVGR